MRVARVRANHGLVEATLSIAKRAKIYAAKGENRKAKMAQRERLYPKGPAARSRSLAAEKRKGRKGLTETD